VTTPPVESDVVVCAVGGFPPPLPQHLLVVAFDELLRSCTDRGLVLSGVATVKVGPSALVAEVLARHRDTTPLLTPQMLASYDQWQAMLGERADSLAAVASCAGAPPAGEPSGG